MPNPTVRVGRNTYAVYKVHYNCDSHGFATRVTLGSRDRWVGSDYWRYLETIQLTPMNRMLRVMIRLEQRNHTDRWVYRRAQAIACQLLIRKTR